MLLAWLQNNSASSSGTDFFGLLQYSKNFLMFSWFEGTTVEHEPWTPAQEAGRINICEARNRWPDILRQYPDAREKATQPESIRSSPHNLVQVLIYSKFQVDLQYLQNSNSLPSFFISRSIDFISPGSEWTLTETSRNDDRLKAGQEALG